MRDGYLISLHTKLFLIVLGNANLVYTIIRKRHVFHALASLPTDCGTINRSLSRRGRKQLGRQPSVESVKDAPSMEVNWNVYMFIVYGIHIYLLFVHRVPTLHCQRNREHTLAHSPWCLVPYVVLHSFTFQLTSSCPGIEKITEQETAHPSLHQLSQLTGAAVAANGAMENITVSHEIEERATVLVQSENADEESNSDEPEKEFVDQGAFHIEPVILDVPENKVICKRLICSIGFCSFFPPLLWMLVWNKSQKKRYPATGCSWSTCNKSPKNALSKLRNSVLPFAVNAEYEESYLLPCRAFVGYLDEEHRLQTF